MSNLVSLTATLQKIVTHLKCLGVLAVQCLSWLLAHVGMSGAVMLITQYTSLGHDHLFGCSATPVILCLIKA
eukprot:5845084-Amphidinium_carterae.1